VTALTGSIGTLTGRVTSRIDRLSEGKFAVLSFVPGGLLILLIVIPPILAVFGMSFFRINLLRDTNTPFVGLFNYQRIPGDAEFLDAVPRTILFALGTTVLTVPLALACALLLNRKFRGAAYLGVAVLLPWAVAPVVTGLYWKFILQSNFGLATGILTALGVVHGPVTWLGDSNVALGSAMVATAWSRVPLPALLLLASLKTIPDSLYRAAKMDGATSWQTFRYVTLPGIRNTLLVVTILTIILALQVFDVLFTLTGGGPGRSTTVISYFVYLTAVNELNFGYASTLAVFLLGVILLCSLALLVVRLRDRGPVNRDEDTASLSRADRRIGAGTSPLAMGTWETAERTAEAQQRGRRIPAGVTRVFAGIGVGLLLFWLLAPIAWIAITSTQPEGAVTVAPPALTAQLRLSNYTQLLQQPEWISSIWQSLVITTLVTFFSIILAALAAYPLARFQLPGKSLIMSVLIFTQMMPAIVYAIPILLVVQAIGLKDTIQALVIVNVAFWLPLIVWLLRGVFEEVPRALDAAARMDGCSRLGTLFRITIPAAAPGIAAVAILLLIGTWNEFLFAVTIGDKNVVTVTRRIGYLDAVAGPTNHIPFTLEAAAGIIAILPCLLLVLAFHRRLVQGLSQGFVKG
jgi:multiple sugar transport system permease protein